MINVMQVMPEFGLAGAEVMCESLVKELQKEGNYSITVVSLYDYHSSLTNSMESMGINVVYLGKRNGVDLGIVFRLIKLMRKHNIQVVHTHRYVMQYVIPAAILAGVPIRVHTVHSIASKEQNRPRRLLAEFFFKYCNVIPVAISPLVRDTIIEEYGLSSNHVPMIYNGVDLAKCVEKTDYYYNETFTFLHVGRLIPLKQQALIIKAIAMLKKEGLPVKVKFVGKGSSRKDYEELATNLEVKESVEFCGAQDNVYSFLKNADAFLLPSLYEGMPMSLIEAMGCGLPIIASRVGGIPDMITNEVSGLLIDAGNLEALASAMKRIINDENLRKSIGLAAKKNAELFSSFMMCKDYCKLYNKECYNVKTL